MGARLVQEDREFKTHVDKFVVVFFDAMRVWRRFCNTPEAQTGLQGFSPVCLSHNGTLHRGLA